MEYDNDRIIKGTYKIEVFCWMALALAGPVLNAVTLFADAPLLWPVLLVVSVMVLPAYILYSRYAVPRLLFRNEFLLFTVASIVTFFVVHGLLFVLYSIATAIVAENAVAYFRYTTQTFVRESAWIVVNGGMAVFVAYLRHKLNEEDKVERLEKENMFYKVRYLRSQPNPHFLFNTLNSIYSLSLNKKDKTPEVVVKLANIMRFFIYECNEDKIPLTKEIEFIRNYIDIEKIRYDADIQFSVEGEVDGIMIEPFLFISFIENGFKHAIDNSFARPFIYITIKVNDDHTIVLNVINNTSLELAAQAKRINGKSIQNSKSVLELLYPDSYALDIIQTEKDERKESKLRVKNAHERLERLYPDAHTLDVILSHNTFTVSLILKPSLLDKMHHSRR
jgi:two-component system, LytTR family, sensor kinase